MGQFWANQVGLGRLYNPELAAAEGKQAQSFQTLKISGQRGGFAALFSTHPPLEERIARLEKTGRA